MKKLKIKGVKLKKGEDLLHYYPTCYCIAKYSETSALFVLPPRQKIGKEKIGYKATDNGYVSVSFDNGGLCKEVKVGDWCEIGYISTHTSGFNRVLKILKYNG